MSTLKRGSPAVISFLLTSYTLTLFDTLDFLPTLSFRSLLLHPSQMILTPYNLLKYNLSSSNLAEHGIHPRWLHVVVNLPMLFGAGLIVVGEVARREWRTRGIEVKDRKERSMTRCGFLSTSAVSTLLKADAEEECTVLLASFVVPLLALSIQPHQEPRFLVPLLVPLVLLASRSSFLPNRQSTRKRRIFWVSHLVFSPFAHS